MSIKIVRVNQMSLYIKSIVDKDILICQPEKGFRFSVDSVYLSWFVCYKKDKKVLDIGSGSGVISALLAKKRGFCEITALEMQDKMTECLKQTVISSEIEEIVKVVQADIKEFKPDGEYDIAVCNPPYRDASTGRVPADETELNARFTNTMCADDVFRFCKRYLKNAGSLYLSYDADLMQDLFESATKYGFEAKRLMPVCPDIHKRPKIILIEFRKNTGREMIFESPLYQEINGEQSEQDKRIMTGDWSV
jgi:tRNA1Val (adenine37-N6)-methyltransferase